MLASARFPLIPFDQITVDTRSPWLVKGLVPRVGMTVVWGPAKEGKTFWILDLSFHVALGCNYRGRRVRGGPVVYCALEGLHGFKARVEAVRREKIPELSADCPEFFLMAAPLNLVADHESFIAAIRQQTPDSPPVAIVIDTLNRSLAGSESDDKDMAAYIRAADAVRDAFNCSVIIVHHCGHDKSRMRGHSSLIGALDTQIGGDGASDGKIVARVELAKDGPTGAKIVSRLKDVIVGYDEDGDAITSCVVLADDDADGNAATVFVRTIPKGAPTVAMRVLRDMLGASSGVVEETAWRKQAYAAGISKKGAKARAKQAAFDRARKSLQDAGFVAISEGKVTAIQ